MIKFSEFIKEDYKNPKNVEKPGSIDVNLIIGRFQPLTLGHVELIRNAAKERKVVIGVVRGAKPDPERSPFSYDLQKEIIDKVLHETSNNLNVAGIIELKSAAIDGVIEALRDKGFELKKIICGADRAKAYISMAKEPKYLTPYGIKNIDVEVLERDPESEGVKGISATKVRESIKAGDYKTTEEMVPGLTRELFIQMRKEMGL